MKYWIKELPKTEIELEFVSPLFYMVRLRFWIARQLFALATWIINSEIVAVRYTELVR